MSALIRECFSQINQNGLISFGTPLPQFINIQFPLDYPNIAPFYSDVDTRIQGSIYYRESQQPELIGAVIQILEENFNSADGFKPTSLLIVTWDSVGYYDRKSDKVMAGQQATCRASLLNANATAPALLLILRPAFPQYLARNSSIPSLVQQQKLRFMEQNRKVRRRFAPSLGLACVCESVTQMSDLSCPWRLGSSTFSSSLPF